MKKQNFLLLDQVSGSRGKEAGDEARDKIEPNYNPDPQPSQNLLLSILHQTKKTLRLIVEVLAGKNQIMGGISPPSYCFK